jgi:hypothetical protein
MQASTGRLAYTYLVFKVSKDSVMAGGTKQLKTESSTWLPAARAAPVARGTRAGEDPAAAALPRSDPHLSSRHKNLRRYDAYSPSAFFGPLPGEFRQGNGMGLAGRQHGGTGA